MANEAARAYWGQPPGVLYPDLARQIGEQREYLWRYQPFNFGVGRAPRPDIPLQHHVFNTLRDRLTDPSVGNHFMEKLNFNPFASPKDLQQMVMIFGDGALDQYVTESFKLYMALPRPKPLFLFVNTVDKLPDNVDFDTARQQIVRGTGHNGVIFEGDRNGKNIRKALWVSTQGNFKVIEGTEEDIYNNVLLRILDHYGSDFVTNREDLPVSPGGVPFITWEQWAGNSVHKDMWEAAQALNNAGVIRDHVDLKKYAQDNSNHVRLIHLAINRSALGESARAHYLSKEGVMAVTPSGGGKVDWDPDPAKGHLVPISHITRDGYCVTIPGGGPEIRFANGSVETNEFLRLLVTMQLAKEEIIGDPESLERWFEDEFKRRERIPVKLYDNIADITIDHSHFHPVPGSVDPRVGEIVEPSGDAYPDLDLPCGSRTASRSTSGLFLQSPAFTHPSDREHPLGGKFVAGVLPGHGVVVAAESREAATDAILNKMHRMDPRWV